MVNAFSCANKLVLGQVKTDAKSNEITAIPELIELLDINGILVSIDAMGCQTDIAQHIVDKGGDYLFTLKSNHKKLHSAVVAAFAKERDTPLGDIRIENKHGRVEARIFHVLSADRINEDFPQWLGKNLGDECKLPPGQGKQEELPCRYHISSAELSEREMADAVRAHWSVENSLHWVLDVSLREDDCQIHQNHGAENWSMLRHMALNMLRAESSKGSIPAEQKRAWMKAEYLETVLSAGFSEIVN